MSEHVPHDMRQGPLLYRLDIDAAGKKTFRLFAIVEQQLPLQDRGRSWWMVLHEYECRAAEVSMLYMKRNLMRAKVYLLAPLHHLQLHHHKLPLTLHRYQAVRRPQVHPALYPRYVAVR